MSDPDSPEARATCVDPQCGTPITPVMCDCDDCESSQVTAARLLIKMLAKDGDPIPEDLWRIAARDRNRGAQ